VLNQRKDDVIRKTVKKLPVQAIIPLAQELTRSMQGRAARYLSWNIDINFPVILSDCPSY